MTAARHPCLPALAFLFCSSQGRGSQRKLLLEYRNSMRPNKVLEKHIKEPEFDVPDSMCVPVRTCVYVHVSVCVCVCTHTCLCALVRVCVKARRLPKVSLLRCLQPLLCLSLTGRSPYTPF